MSKKINQWLIIVTLIISVGLFLPFQLINISPLKTFLLVIVGLITFLLILIQKFKAEHFKFTNNLFILSIFTLLGSIILSSIFSNNILISLFGRQITVYSLVGTLSLFALAYSVYFVFDNIKGKIKLFSTFFIVSVLVLFLNLAFTLFSFLPSLGYFTSSISNTIGNWYDLGFFGLFVTLSSVLVLQHFKSASIYRSVAILGLILGLCTILLVNATSIYIVAIGFSLLYLVIYSFFIKNNEETEIIGDENKKQTLSPYLFIVFALSVLFLLIGGKTGVILDSMFNIQYSDVRPSVTATLEVAQEVFLTESFSTKLFGVGIDRFDTAWLQYKPDSVNLSQFWDTDFRFGYSFVTTNLVNQGLIGAIAWIFFILMSFVYIFRLMIQKNKHMYSAFIHQYSAFGFLFFLIVLLIYTPSFIIFGLFFVFLGLFITSLESADFISYKIIDLNQKKSLIHVFSIIIISIVVFYGVYIQASQYISRIIFDNTSKVFIETGSIEDTLEGISRSKFIFNSDVYSRAMMDLGMFRLNQIIQDSSLSQEEATSQFSETIQAIVFFGNEAITFDPKSYINRMTLLNVYKELVALGVDGAKTEAISLIESTQAIVPNNPTLYLEKARTYALSEEYDIAKEIISQAIEIKPNFTAAIFLLSQIQVENGENENAISSIQNALSISQFDPGLHFQLGLLYYQEDRFNEAILAFERARSLAINFVNARYFLGLSYYYADRVSNAITVFENLNQEFPENNEVQIILNNLINGNTPFENIQPPLDTRPEQREELPFEEDDLTIDVEEEDSETEN